MKDSLLIGMDKETKDFILSNPKVIQKIFNIFLKKLHDEYIRAEETKLKPPSATPNWSKDQAYWAGYQAAVLMSLKLHNLDLKSIIPDHE